MFTVLEDKVSLTKTMFSKKNSKNNDYMPVPRNSNLQWEFHFAKDFHSRGAHLKKIIRYGWCVHFLRNLNLFWGIWRFNCDQGRCFCSTILNTVSASDILNWSEKFFKKYQNVSMTWNNQGKFNMVAFTIGRKLLEHRFWNCVSYFSS